MYDQKSPLKPGIKRFNVKFTDLMQYCISCQRRGREPAQHNTAGGLIRAEKWEELKRTVLLLYKSVFGREIWDVNKYFYVCYFWEAVKNGQA